MAGRWAKVARATSGATALPGSLPGRDSAGGSINQQDGGAAGASTFTPGLLLAFAYPDRVARSRGAGGAFLLANGRGATIDVASPLARAPFLAVAEIAGTAAQGRIVLAAALTLAEIETHFSTRIESRDEIVFDDKSASLRGRRLRRLGALSLAEQTQKVEPSDTATRGLVEGIARLGIDRLPWTNALRQWRDRVLPD